MLRIKQLLPNSVCQQVTVQVLAILCLLFSAQAQAHRSVVIIPMSGDDLQPLKNIITVAKANGDFDNPVNAINSIPTTGSDMPGAANPYLIVIAPGVYPLGNIALNMRQFIDVMGSGENVTLLTGTIGSAGDVPSSALVTTANNAVLSSLSVENTGSSARTIGIYGDGYQDSTARIEHVTVSAAGGSTYNHGIFIGIISTLMMTHVTATATGGENSYGVMNANSLAIMNQVTATASDATNNSGVYNWASRSTMNLVTATASGGTNNHGVFNNFDSDSVMNQVTASASGGSFNYGVYNFDSSSPIMTQVTATATDGKSYGIYNENSARPVIRRSTMEGETFGLITIFDVTTPGGATVSQSTILNGATGPNLKCVAVDDGAGIELDSICSPPP